MKNLSIILLFVSTIALAEDLPQKTTLTAQEKNNLLQFYNSDYIFAKETKDTSNALRLYSNYNDLLNRINYNWYKHQRILAKIDDFGSTEKLEVIQLIGRDRPDLKGRGVSYLIRTDNQEILMDTGFDSDSNSSAFAYNIKQLGYKLSDIDIIFISREHKEHTNNWTWDKDQTFSPHRKDLLDDIKIIIPHAHIKLTHSTTTRFYPMRLGDGIYSTGVIVAPTFFYTSREQVLLINVQNKGIIAIIACGYISVKKLTERIKLLTDIPLYGIIGSLHYPLNLPPQEYNYNRSEHLPWEPLQKEDIQNDIDELKALKLQKIWFNDHNSSNDAVELLMNIFGTNFIPIKTGEVIKIE